MEETKDKFNNLIQELTTNKANVSDVNNIVKYYADQIEDINANISDVNNLIYRVNETDKQVYETLADHNDVLAQHGNALDNHDEILNNHDKILNNNADYLEDIIENKADKATVANKLDVESNTARIATNSLNIQSLRTTKADAVELARVDNQVKSNQTAIASVKSQVSRNAARIQDVEDRTNKLHQKLRHGLAAQAALTGLFQPYNVGKANISAAVGGYRSTTAVAVGTGYRFNEHVATKAGIAFSTGGNRAVSYHAGVNYEW